MPGTSRSEADSEQVASRHDRDEADHDSGPENHLALVYETVDEQLAAVIPFVREGLEQNERVMYVVDENSRESLIESFRAAGIDVDAALESGSLSFHSKADTYFHSGPFDAAEMIEFIDESAREVVENDAYDRLRITGEMTWALGEDTETLDRLVEYERTINEYYPGNPVIGLCQYNRSRFSPDLLHDIIRAHPHQVYNATVTQNFAYLPPEEFFESQIPSVGVEEFVDTHLDRMRARGKLQEREQTLSTLAESSRDILHGDTHDIVDRTVTTLERALSPSVAAAFFYDEETDSIEPEAVSTAAGTELVALPERYEELLWDTFVSDDAKVFSNFQAEETLPSMNEVLQSGMTFPLGRYGVLFVGSTRAHAFDEVDVEFAQTVATSAHAALKRAERERQLEQQNEQLRHLNRINRTIRRIDQALVQATSREEIETVVCQRLADTESYQFAWIGDRDPLTRDFRPRQWAGEESTYLDDVYAQDGADADEPAGDFDVVDSPARKAAASGEPCTVQNSLTTTEFEAWRQVALENDFYSAISIPLIYNETTYGVLSVYSGESNVFTEMEQAVLTELGATIAYAIDVAETKVGLHTDQLTEVGLRITDAQAPLLRLARQLDATFDVNTVLPESEETLRLFFTVPEASAEQVLAATEGSTSVSTIRQISERAEDDLFEAVLRVDSSLPAAMSAFDGSVTSLSASPEAVDAVVAVPSTADVRGFVEQFQEAYPETSVTSVQRVTKPLKHRGEFYGDVEDRLTDRQFEALRLAYYSGYFDWPRESSASEVAESLGVTQPTFSGHLRAGEQKLLSLLFEDR